LHFATYEAIALSRYENIMRFIIANSCRTMFLLMVWPIFKDC